VTDEELDNALLDARLTKARQRKTSDAGYDSNFMLKGAWDQAKKFGESYAKGSSIGESLPVIGKPIADLGTKIASGLEAAAETPFSESSFGQLYDRNQKAAQKAEAERNRYDAASPLASFSKSALAGLTVPGVSASRTSKLIPEATSWAGRLWRFGAQTAERGVKAAGVSAADTLSRGGSGEDAIDSAKYAAMFQGGADVVPQIAKGLGHGYSRFVAQIPGEDLAYYRANRPAVQSIDPQNTYEEMSAAGREMKKRGELIGEQAGRSEAEAIRQAEAEAALKRNQYASTAVRERSEGMGQARELKEGVAKSEAQDLAESENVRRGLATDIAALPKKARAAISASSQAATELAIASGKNVKIAPFRAVAQRNLNDLLVTLSDEGGEQAQAIKKWLSRLDTLEDKVIPVAKFRRLTQDLDDDIEHIYAAQAAGQRIGPGGRALMDIRRGMSEKAKKIIPGYRQAMKETSTKMGPLKDFQEQFGNDPDAIYRQMGDIHSPGREARLGALEAADTAFGGGIKPNLDKLKDIQGRDYAPQLEKAKSIEGLDYEGNYELPNLFVEAEKGRKIGEAAEKFKPEYARGKDIADLSKGLGKDENARAFMEKYGRRPEQFNDRRKQMEAIALAEGKPINYYTDQARNAYVKRAMTGGQIQGSRLTKLGAEAGGAVAEAAGMHGGSKIMSFLGSTAGAVSDVVGKTVVRKIVDAIDSPRGQKFAQIYSEAAKRGPQAIAITHTMLMQKDPEYKQLMEETGP
jgi:hypothetical protein